MFVDAKPQALICLLFAKTGGGVGSRSRLRGPLLGAPIRRHLPAPNLRRSTFQPFNPFFHSSIAKLPPIHPLCFLHLRKIGGGGYPGAAPTLGGGGDASRTLKRRPSRRTPKLASLAMEKGCDEWRFIRRRGLRWRLCGWRARRDMMREEDSHDDRTNRD